MTHAGSPDTVSKNLLISSAESLGLNYFSPLFENSLSMKMDFEILVSNGVKISN